MTHWMRFERNGQTGFGVADGDVIQVHEGDMYAANRATGERVKQQDVKVRIPVQPTKVIGLVDNFHALVVKLNHAVPAEPLYFFKGNNSLIAHGETIRVPKSYGGKVVYEGELGVVIGRRCFAVSESEAQACIFGYTCVNDVTAVEILNRDPGFAQWTRAKSFDTFGALGPVVATGIDPAGLSIRTLLNDQERQNYAVSDMIFSPAKLVSLISQDLTLEPGDVIACGTSVGVGSMKPGSTVSICIEGIGTLTNRFE